MKLSQSAHLHEVPVAVVALPVRLVELSQNVSEGLGRLVEHCRRGGEVKQGRGGEGRGGEGRGGEGEC